MDNIRIGGFTPLTTTDYPGQLAAVVFCQGCSWNCRYCHNPHLIPAEGPSQTTWPEILAFLAKRQGLLDAVVFSGGEPTLQGELESAIRNVRELGFKVGLHTAGMYPKRLEQILPLVDWVGMDIKAPFEDYENITKVPDSGNKAKSSAQILINSGITHEFRTTWHPLLLGYHDLLKLAHELASLGANHYVLQDFRAQGCKDKELNENPVNNTADHPITELLAPYFETFSIRTA